MSEAVADPLVSRVVRRAASSESRTAVDLLPGVGVRVLLQDERLGPAQHVVLHLILIFGKKRARPLPHPPPSPGGAKKKKRGRLWKKTKYLRAEGRGAKRTRVRARASQDGVVKETQEGGGRLRRPRDDGGRGLRAIQVRKRPFWQVPCAAQPVPKAPDPNALALALSHSHSVCLSVCPTPRQGVQQERVEAGRL